jgi:cardiolipin synthase (CMP-forming)
VAPNDTPLGPDDGSEALTLADALSLSRVVFGGALWLVGPTAGPTLALMAAAAISDVADGWLARRLRGPRPVPPGGGRGAWLDPVCDKAFTLSLIGVLVVRLRLPFWLLALVGARELLLLLALALAPWGRRPPRSLTFTATALGKATTGLQFGALALLVAQARVSAAAVAIAASSALTGAAAVVGYVMRARRKARP